MNAALTFDEFARRYCERQEQTPEGLRAVLEDQVKLWHPDGWALLECVTLDGSRLGELVIVPYGKNNTWKVPPDKPVSPRGLASDMSVVVAVMDRSAL